jgi:hypothetical protein
MNNVSLATIHAPKLASQGDAKTDGRPGVDSVDRFDEARCTYPLNGHVLATLWAAQATGHHDVHDRKSTEGAQEYDHTGIALTSPDTSEGHHHEPQ